MNKFINILLLLQAPRNENWYHKKIEMNVHFQYHKILKENMMKGGGEIYLIYTSTLLFKIE